MALNRRIVFPVLAGLVAAASGAALWHWQAGTPAPVVDYTLLDGKKMDSAQWRGKVMVVNFWATSCTTCVKEMPELMRTHQRFKDQAFDTLAVAMQYDPPDYVAQFAQTRQLPFGVAIDNTGAIAHAFGPVRMTPTTFVIDKQGRIVKRILGEPDFPALHKLIEELLSA
ncbi:peroxiredoxin [Inhella inkyongensis]|uniref:Peroxiredoxin n=1 Tax=Inhella inkyongensis TaxID=392593 RepID=A0A840SBP4_9BURK|nr:TlpA disulfide reductase family protein [Inhella inkyongensis]MBB5206194.1 peroxiredoxin [Inhella inkyongensis]